MLSYRQGLIWLKSRAILLYNKHGLLLDEFERVYRVTTEKKVPFKLLGFNSTEELLNNIPEYAKVVHTDEGLTLVVAVTNEKTLHVAKLVGNQEFRKSGFNRRTVDAVSRLTNQTISKISEEVGFRDREVSDLVKSQVRELLEMDSNLNGILLSQLPTEYDKMYSYHIDEGEYGFTNLEDFCLNGLADVVDLDLDCGNFKIVEKGLIGRTKSICVPKSIPNKVKASLKSLIRNNERREMRLEDLRRKYSETFEPLKLFEFGCPTFLELCLLLPDCLQLRLSSSGDWICHSVEAETSELSGDLTQVAGNVAELLKGHKEGVELRVFLRGYEGLHGSIHKVVKEVGASGVKDLLSMLETVCLLETASDGEVMVVPTQLASASVPADVIANIQSLLEKHPAGLPIVELPQSFLAHTGDILDNFKLGFQSLSSFCLHLTKDQSNHIFKSNHNLHLSPQGPRTGAGWVRILQVRGTGQLVVQEERGRGELREVEQAMEEFYRLTGKDEEEEEEVTEGSLVAAPYTDLAWHRAQVESVTAGWAQLTFLDWSWRARLRLPHLRQLQPGFCLLPAQARTITRQQVSLANTSQEDWGQLGGGRGRGRLVRGEENKVALQLFFPCRAAVNINNNNESRVIGQFRNYEKRTNKH